MCNQSSLTCNFAGKSYGLRGGGIPLLEKREKWGTRHPAKKA
jgi:hypothetical protein